MFVKRLLLGDRPTASNMQSGGEGAMKNRGQKKVSMATVRRARHCVPGTVRLEVPPPQRVLMCYWLFQANRRCCD